MNTERLIYPGFWFGKSDFKEAERLAEEGVGGFCIYFGTPKEIENFSKRMKELSPYSNILICADYEDGLGRWVQGTELLPSNMAIGAGDSEDLAMKKGLITARQARSIGVDWVFAPVIDLAENPDNPIVNTRAFGEDKQLVYRMASAFLIGLSQGGALNSLKHFPGHGATDIDSHLALPVINKTQEELFNSDLDPYRRLLRFADSIMIGHLTVPAVDPDKPASLSAKTIQSLLKNRLNYRGCVVTDALLMKAVAGRKNLALEALEAGVDILLAPENPAQMLKDLKAAVNDDKKWFERISHSLATQEMLISKYSRAEVRTPEHALAKTKYSEHAAEQCITVLGGGDVLQPKDIVHYIDIDSPVPFMMTPFAQKLAEEGVVLQPFTGKAGKLLVASYNGYASFKGSINLNPAQKDRLKSAVSAAGQTYLVSFGSPFVFKGFTGKAALTALAYTPNEDFQYAVARTLLGQLKPKGKLPVTLE